MLYAAIGVSALITFLLRFVPMQMMRNLGPDSALGRLAEYLPPGLMLILVAYTFVQASSPTQALRLAIGAVIALVCELKWSNTLVSFCLGIAAFSLSSLWLS